MKQGITGKTGITLRGAAAVSIAAAVAFALVLTGTGKRQDAADRAVAAETPAVKTDAPTTRYVRTIAIVAQPLLASWPPPVVAVPSPAVETPAAPARAAKGPRQPNDVCQRHGGYRLYYQRGHWIGWRCVFPTKATKESRR